MGTIFWRVMHWKFGRSSNTAVEMCRISLSGI
jgi:hypothetical protein